MTFTTVSTSIHLGNAEDIRFEESSDKNRLGWISVGGSAVLHLPTDHDNAEAILDRIIAECESAKTALAERRATVDAQHKGGNPFHGFSE